MKNKYAFIVKNSSPELIKTFFDTRVNLKKIILLEKNITLGNNKNPLIGTATFAKYTPNKVLIDTSSSKNAILFLSDTYCPGWNIYIDGKKTELLRADYAFKGVVIPQGKHTVDFKYGTSFI